MSIVAYQKSNGSLSEVDKVSYRQKRNACHYIAEKKGGRDNGKSKGQSVVWQCPPN